MQDCNIIIIIRGGGDVSEISNSFDHIELFDIIKKSKIPIITAIGHEQDKGDKLLITNVSDIDFSTPTACAKDLNKKFYIPLIQKIENLIILNKELFDSILKIKNDRLYNKLNNLLGYFIEKIFGGDIIEVNSKTTHVIIEKNGKYYKNELSFDKEIEFDKQHIIFRNNIIDALEEENIDIIEDIFNQLKTSNNGLSTDIKNNIIKIKENSKIWQYYNQKRGIKNEYYLKVSIPKSNSLKKLIKINEIF